MVRVHIAYRAIYLSIHMQHPIGTSSQDTVCASWFAWVRVWMRSSWMPCRIQCPMCLLLCNKIKFVFIRFRPDVYTYIGVSVYGRPSPSMGGCVCVCVQCAWNGWSKSLLLLFFVRFLCLSGAESSSRVSVNICWHCWYEGECSTRVTEQRQTVRFD